jgi:hypothetical protein
MHVTRGEVGERGRRVQVAMRFVYKAFEEGVPPVLWIVELDPRGETDVVHHCKQAGEEQGRGWCGGTQGEIQGSCGERGEEGGWGRGGQGEKERRAGADPIPAAGAASDSMIRGARGVAAGQLRRVEPVRRGGGGVPLRALLCIHRRLCTALSPQQLPRPARHHRHRRSRQPPRARGLAPRSVVLTRCQAHGPPGQRHRPPGQGCSAAVTHTD